MVGRNLHEGAKRIQILSLSPGHILLDVLKIKGHERLDSMIRLDQPVLREPGLAGGRGEKITDRFRHAAGREGKEHHCRTSAMDENVS